MASKRDEPIAPARPLSGGPGQRPPLAPPIPEGPGTSLTSRFRRDKGAGTPTEAPRQVRQAKLRLVQVEPWSVMKASFLLSVAVAIVTVVAVAIIWGVLSAAGLWDSVNSIIQDTVGDTKGEPFDIEAYVGTSRILGFTMIVAVADVILITAIATLGAFLYNLTATLVGGIEVTFAEDK